MGGRGIHVENHNSQINLEHYLFGQEIKEIHSRAEAFRKESSQIESISGLGAGSGTAHSLRSAMKRCACCRNYSVPAFSQYETCPICGWIDDPLQNRNPELETGANPLSLNEARLRWREKTEQNNA